MRVRGGRRVAAVSMLVGTLIATSCGTDSADGPPADDGTAIDVATGVLPAVDEPVVECDITFVPAGEVTVVGDLSADETELADWALSRFAEAELLLPSVLEIGFDPTRARCSGARGLCVAGGQPPAAIVCEAEGTTMFRIVNRRVTLLHELAHLWAAGDVAPDARAIVGGEPTDRADGGDIAWADRTEERVAMTISWGLLDQLRRPIDADIACAELYRWFVALTGREPLGPIELVCLPPDTT